MYGGGGVGTKGNMDSGSGQWCGAVLKGGFDAAFEGLDRQGLSVRV